MKNKTRVSGINCTTDTIFSLNILECLSILIYTLWYDAFQFLGIFGEYPNGYPQLAGHCSYAGLGQPFTIMELLGLVLG